MRGRVATALLVLLAAGSPRTEDDPVLTVTIVGPVTGFMDRDVALAATVTGLEEPISYSWSIASGPALIESSGSSATVRATGMEPVVVRVLADGGTTGSAEDTHAIDIAGGPEDRQKPNDMNGDGMLDISDPVATLNHLFIGFPGPLCGDGAIDHAANLRLLDANGSGQIDISDPLYVLGFIFLGGPRPANCLDDTCPCMLIADCPVSDSCHE